MDQYQSEIELHELPAGLDLKQLKGLLSLAASDHDMIIGNLVYNFVPREIIVEINTKFLNHNYSTDIITFDYVEGNEINGEVYICPEQVEENAHQYEVDSAQELVRVITHGILHLIGFKDGTEKEKTLMRRMEEKYLTRWNEVVHG